jgi:hypothetical protein
MGLGATPNCTRNPFKQGVSPENKIKGQQNPVLWSHQLYRLLHFLCLKQPIQRTIAEESGYYLCMEFRKQQ